MVGVSVKVIGKVIPGGYLGFASDAGSCGLGADSSLLLTVGVGDAELFKL